MSEVEVEEMREEGDRLYCFQDGGRACGPECMAYLTFPPVGPDYDNKPFSRCQVLVTQHQTAKHLTIIAKHLSQKQMNVDTLTPAKPR